MVTTRKDSKPTSGAPAWIVTGVQAALFITATLVCFQATNHVHQWLLTTAAAAAVGWALTRPDSPATTVWILTIGAWWLTGLATPGLITTLQAALLVLACHYLTAVRSSVHRSTRLSYTYLARCLAALTSLMLATALAALLIDLISSSAASSDQWAITWTTVAIATLAGLSVWLTRDPDPEHERTAMPLWKHAGQA